MSEKNIADLFITKVHYTVIANVESLTFEMSNSNKMQDPKDNCQPPKSHYEINGSRIRKVVMQARKRNSMISSVQFFGENEALLCEVNG